MSHSTDTRSRGLPENGAPGVDSSMYRPYSGWKVGIVELRRGRVLSSDRTSIMRIRIWIHSPSFRFELLECRIERDALKLHEDFSLSKGEVRSPLRIVKSHNHVLDLHESINISYT